MSTTSRNLALGASLGCGNPTAVADLQPGEVVLDLGSGAGLDVLLSARRVGPTGFVYGLDATVEMVELARRNVADAGVQNVGLLHGTIEHIPVDDGSVDVVISNCVIVLTDDKPVVFAEITRVLRPGGRVCISDIIRHGDDDGTPLVVDCAARALRRGLRGRAPSGWPCPRHDPSDRRTPRRPHQRDRRGRQASGSGPGDGGRGLAGG
jgi:ubiquinone/menaquinone biosynthesis C-methylase UbiE